MPEPNHTRRWLKLYVDLLDNHDFNYRLSNDSTRMLFIRCLMLHRKGQLVGMTAPELARRFSKRIPAILRQLSELSRIGFLQCSDHTVQGIPSWEKWQGPQGASTQRTRKYRDREKARHGDVTVTDIQKEKEIEKEIRKEKGKKKDPENGHKDSIDSVIGHLRKITQRDWRTDSGSTRGLILARLNAGATVEQMTAVITHKWDEWGDDDEMRPRVCPGTLFGPKNFGRYAAEIEAQPLEPGEEPGLWGPPDLPPEFPEGVN